MKSAVSSGRISTEISVLDSDRHDVSLKTVRVQSGPANKRTHVEVTLSESRFRHRRRRRERRGSRWTRGKLDLRFRTLEPPRERHTRSGTISLVDGSGMGEITHRERMRGRQITDKYQKIQKTIKGIPFNYFNTLNRIFTRLSVPSQRPYTDYTVSSLSLKDNGNGVPLSVMGISTCLMDLGYSQKDFVVGAKAVFIGDEILVEPCKDDEERINLESLEPGQGILMLEYFALSQRVAHIFTKGQISAASHAKGLGMCISICKDLADSAVALLRTKYDRTSLSAQKMIPRSADAAATPAVSSFSSGALKSSFSDMLSSTGSGVAQLALSSTGKAAVPSKVTNATKPAIVGGKKLSLADLAKGKK